MIYLSAINVTVLTGFITGSVFVLPARMDRNIYASVSRNFVFLTKFYLKCLNFFYRKDAMKAQGSQRFV
jgi:hypothetical protein